jgi:hypothetical protein
VTTITNLERVLENRLTWPESKSRAAHRTKSPFRSREVATEQREIEYELERWRIRQFIISRNHQRIYAGDPGAAVWWLDRKRQLRVLACDKWTTLGENLHAIRLTLEAMRALERWGAYTAEQAAEGARPALPPPGYEAARRWREVLAMPHADGLSAEDQLVLAERRYRERSRGKGEADLELNAAIEAARKELRS